MDYINLKLTIKGTTCYYAVAIHDPNELIHEGEIYVSKDGDEYFLRKCRKGDGAYINPNSNSRRWKYCYKIHQLIETDEHGMAQFYLCIDSARKNMYIFRGDQDRLPKFNEGLGIYEPNKIKTVNGDIDRPAVKCVDYTEKAFKDVDPNTISNRDLCKITADAIGWLKFD